MCFVCHMHVVNVLLVLVRCSYCPDLISVCVPFMSITHWYFVLISCLILLSSCFVIYLCHLSVCLSFVLYFFYTVVRAVLSPTGALGKHILWCPPSNAKKFFLKLITWLKVYFKITQYFENKGP